MNPSAKFVFRAVVPVVGWCVLLGGWLAFYALMWTWLEPSILMCFSGGIGFVITAPFAGAGPLLSTPTGAKGWREPGWRLRTLMLVALALNLSVTILVGLDKGWKPAVEGVLMGVGSMALWLIVVALARNAYNRLLVFERADLAASPLA